MVFLPQSQLSPILCCLGTSANHQSSAAQQPKNHAQKMRSGASYYTGCEDEHYQPHFLDSCSLCHKPISQDSDIFMYRGNKPFCSQECRQEQIDIDEASEKRWKLSSSKRSNTARQNTESTKESHTKKTVRTGTVVVA